MNKKTTWQTLTPVQHIPLNRAIEYATTNPHGIIDISPETIKWMQYALTRLADFKERTAVPPRDGFTQKVMKPKN